MFFSTGKRLRLEHLFESCFVFAPLKKDHENHTLDCHNHAAAQSRPAGFRAKGKGLDL